MHKNIQQSKWHTHAYSGSPQFDYKGVRDAQNVYGHKSGESQNVHT